ncbi:MAG: hypothetical protein ACTSR3_12455 [Candidatus Helarchaeota archaeon]
MMATLLFAIEEIVKLDPTFKNLIKNKDLIIQWVIEEGGPSFFFKIKDERFESRQDQNHPNPDIKIIIHNLKSAMKILNGSSYTIREEIKAENADIIGSDEKTKQFFPILDHIQNYMIDLRV